MESGLHGTGHNLAGAGTARRQGGLGTRGLGVGFTPVGSAGTRQVWGAEALVGICCPEGGRCRHRAEAVGGWPWRVSPGLQWPWHAERGLLSCSSITTSRDIPFGKVRHHAEVISVLWVVRAEGLSGTVGEVTDITVIPKKGSRGDGDVEWSAQRAWPG